MKILFVVPYVPSLVRNRSYNLIRHLSARGHRVTVATLWSNDRERIEAQDLGADCHEVRGVHIPPWRSLLNCSRALLTSEPLQSVYSWSSDLYSEISRLRAHADVVHVEHLRGARYGLALAQEPRAAAPIVWDSVDCISYLFEQAVDQRRDRVGRLVTRLELPRTRRAEGQLVRSFARVLISSETDKEAVLRLNARPGPEPKVTVVPNGVDTTYFTPSGQLRDSRLLIFSGKMSYHANVSAVEHLLLNIMPLVWASRPDVRLMIVGKNPPEKLRALAARHGQLVTVTGTVPDIRPYLRQASAAVIPLRYGAGSQFKVLEAMACATPVVATPRAVSALAARPDRELLVAEGPPAFAASVLQLLDNPEKQREIGEAGRRYVENHHRWDGIAGRVAEIYEEVLAEQGQPAMALGA